MEKYNKKLILTQLEKIQKLRKKTEGMFEEIKGLADEKNISAHLSGVVTEQVIMERVLKLELAVAELQEKN